MAKYKVIAARTMFMVKEVEADSVKEAELLAYSVDPIEWDQHQLSGVCEHFETVKDDNPLFKIWEDMK